MSRPKLQTTENPMEDNYRSLSHTKWQCKYHIVFAAKYRRKTLFKVSRKQLGEVFHRLARQKECEIEEGHIMPDHVHILISIPPKHSVSSVVGYLKGKSAIHVARHLCGRKRNYSGHSLWARGYFVDTVGRNTDAIRRYIKNQEAEDKRLDQLEFSDPDEDNNPNEPKNS